MRIPALDGLRGWAILLVLLWHSVFQASVNSHPVLRWILRLGRMSWSGVDLFFVLSGFLIGGILIDARESPNYFKTFYLRRAFRILPLYFLLLSVCWLAFRASILGGAPENWTAALFNGPVPWWSFFTFTQNIGMAAAGQFSGSGLAVTWSLAIEEQFYLSLPLIVRSVSRKRLLYVTFGIIAGAALLRVVLIHFFPFKGPFACYVLMPCRADALGLGVLSAILVREETSWNYMVRHRRLLYACSGVLLLGVFGVILQAYPLFTVALHGLEYSVLALFYASVLLIAVTGEDRFVRMAFCNWPLMKLGSIAYGTYLLHYICLNIFHRALISSHVSLTAASTLGTSFAALATAVLLAALSWVLFEKPLVRRGRAFRY